MTDELTKQLQAWGFAKANRYGPAHDDTPRVHQLERAKDFAPGTRERAARQLIGRDGRERRAFMAAGAGVPGLKVVPMWSCDPVRAANDASPPRDLERVAVEVPVPDSLRWIDRAVAQLSRSSEIRAMVLVEEFTTAGSQSVKARRVQERYGGKFSVWMYRRELQRAIDWLGGKMAA